MVQRSTQIAFALSVLIIASRVEAGLGVINVPADFSTIQAAIDAASNGDEVIVAIGTYPESISFKGKNITVRSTDPNDPAIVATTIIDATGLTRAVLCNRDEPPTTLLSGFTIKGGNATGAFPNDVGGGMLIQRASPTVINCVFTGNDAIWGGGLCILGSDPIVSGCTFELNSADKGGGLYISGSNPTIEECTFEGNAAEFGAGLFNNNSDSKLTSCRFDSNVSSDDGGGMFNNGGCVPMLTECTFSLNTAVDKGGGMFNLGCAPDLNTCDFDANSADRGGG
ncbi:MAG: right-handed parallel beta-helix repeat-containing protein, partial [Planctomycetota bacterium]|nr:right-handed parallel beta-helix repeat-containing protein [Planctomycetota bacterium]